MAAGDLARQLFLTASSNNLAKFEATLTQAKEAVESMPVGEARNRLRRAVITATDLDRVWRFDGIYWDEDSLPDYYDRLAGEYRDFEAFIAQYRVVDRSGRVLYPKQETRDFLVRKLKPQPNSKKRST